MNDVVQEVGLEYQAKLEQIKSESEYDIVELSGSPAEWKEVLAVYAVKIAADPESPLEVVTINDEKKQTIRLIFWDMTQIVSHIEIRNQTVTETFDDGNGNIVESEKVVELRCLCIQVSSVSALNMAEKYEFTAEQEKQLEEILQLQI